MLRRHTPVRGSVFDSGLCVVLGGLRWVFGSGLRRILDRRLHVVFPNGKFFPNCLNYMLTLVCFGGFWSQFRLRGSTITRTRTRGSAKWLDSRFPVCSCRQSPASPLSA